MNPEVATSGTFKASDVIATGAEAVFIAEEGKPPSGFEVVLVRPGESQNRRFYSKEAIQQAVDSGFWNNTKMFLDHGTDKNMPMARSIKDLVAGIDSTRVGDAGEAIGVGRFFRPDFAAFAAEAKDHMGVSIVHQFKGQRYRGSDGHTHERVDQFLTNYSADWVAFPAAGGAINNFLPAHESQSEDDVEWSELTVDMVKAHAPDVHNAIVTEAQADMSPSGTGSQDGDGSGTAEVPVGLTADAVATIVAEAIEKHDRERDEKLAASEAIQTQIAALVDASGLPDLTRKRITLQFAGATEFAEESVKTAIEDTKAEIAAIKGGPVVSGLGSSLPASTTTSTPHTPALNAVEAAFGVKFADVVSEGSQA